MKIRPIDRTGRKQVDAFLVRQWYTMQMVVHGERIDLGSADGFYTCDGDEMIGLVTYRVSGKEMEILSLDSLHEHKGIGTLLLNAAIGKARDSSLERIRIVHRALWGSCGIDCEFCSGCDNRGGGRIESIYQPYIDGLKEIREINEDYRAPFVRG